MADQTPPLPVKRLSARFHSRQHSVKSLSARSDRNDLQRQSQALSNPQDGTRRPSPPRRRISSTPARRLGPVSTSRTSSPPPSTPGSSAEGGPAAGPSLLEPGPGPGAYAAAARAAAAALAAPPRGGGGGGGGGGRAAGAGSGPGRGRPGAKRPRPGAPPARGAAAAADRSLSRSRRSSSRMRPPKGLPSASSTDGSTRSSSRTDRPPPPPPPPLSPLHAAALPRAPPGGPSTADRERAAAAAAAAGSGDRGDCPGPAALGAASVGAAEGAGGGGGGGASGGGGESGRPGLGPGGGGGGSAAGSGRGRRFFQEEPEEEKDVGEGNDGPAVKRNDSFSPKTSLKEKVGDKVQNNVLKGLGTSLKSIHLPHSPKTSPKASQKENQRNVLKGLGASLKAIPLPHGSRKSSPKENQRNVLKSLGNSLKSIPLSYGSPKSTPKAELVKSRSRTKVLERGRSTTRIKDAINFVKHEVLPELGIEYHHNPFSSWTIEHIQLFFVAQKIELRGSAAMSQKELAKIADACYKNKDAPPRKPRLPTPYEQAAMHHAIDVIQAAYFHYRARNFIRFRQNEVLRDEYLQDGIAGLTGRSHLSMQTLMPSQEAFFQIVRAAVEESKKNSPATASPLAQRPSGSPPPAPAAPPPAAAAAAAGGAPPPAAWTLGAEGEGEGEVRPGPAVGHRPSVVAAARALPMSPKNALDLNATVAKKELQVKGNKWMNQFDHDGEELKDENPDVSSKSKKVIRKNMRQNKRVSTTMANWVAPSEELAEVYAARMHPRQIDGSKYPLFGGSTTGRFCWLGGCGQQCDFFNEGMVSEFCQYGVGVTNYFKFIKWCGWVMFMLSIFSVPSLTINKNGIGYIVQGQISELATTSYGNLGESVNITHVELPFCDPSSYHGQDCLLNKCYIGMIYGWIDAVAVVLVIIATLWLKYFSLKEAKLIDKHTVTVTDFTVYVPWIPCDTKEAELKSHFETTTGFAVKDIAIGRDQRKEIEFYKGIGKLYTERQWLTNYIQYLRSESPGDPDIKAGRKERVLLGKEILMMMKQRRKFDFSKQAVCAYVTFEEEDGMIQCRSIFQHSALNQLIMKKHLKFKGKKIKALPSPMPSLIMWENLGFAPRDRLFRKAQTAALALAMISVSTLVAFLAIEFEQRANEQYDYSPCPKNFGSLSKEDQVAAVVEDPTIIHCYCSEVYLHNVGPSHVCYDYVTVQTRGAFVIVLSSMIVVTVNAIMNIVFRYMGRIGMHRSIDEMEHTVFRNIFLLKFLNTGIILLLVNSSYIVQAFGLQIEAADDFNAEWYRSAGTSIVLTLLMNVVSPHFSPVGFMLLLRMRYRKFRAQCITQDELNKLHCGHHMKISTRYAELLTIFYVCFMFSAGLPILPFIGAASFFVFFWVDKYLFINFYKTPPTYSEALGLRVVSALPYSIILHCLVAIWQLSNKSLFNGGDWDEDWHSSTEDGYSINAKFQSELARPIIYVMGGVLIVRVAKAVIGKLHPVILVILNFATCSYYHGHNVDDDDDDDIERASVYQGGQKSASVGSRNTIWGSSMGRRGTLRNLNRAVSTRLKGSVGATLRGKVEKTVKKANNVLDVTYSQALARGLLKGLVSYNILENPVYREAFAVSESFAKKYKHVDDVNRLVVQRPSIMQLDRDFQALGGAQNLFNQENGAPSTGRRGRQAMFISAPKRSPKNIMSGSHSKEDPLFKLRKDTVRDRLDSVSSYFSLLSGAGRSRTNTNINSVRSGGVRSRTHTNHMDVSAQIIRERDGSVISTFSISQSKYHNSGSGSGLSRLTNLFHKGTKNQQHDHHHHVHNKHQTVAEKLWMKLG